MRKFTFLLIALLAIVGYANAAVDSSIAGKKVTAVGAATTTIDTEAWYLLYCQSRGCYVSEETTSFIMRGTDKFTTPVAASEKAGYMFQFVATENANEYYIKSGNGLYFKITQGGSVVSNEPVAYTIAQIGDNAGHFYGQLVEDGRVLDANGAGGALAGWNTTVPAGTGGNNDYQFLPLTLEAASFVNVTYNFTYEGKVIYTQQSLVEEGADFPDYTVTLPYAVTAAAKPTGEVSAENATHEIALAVGELPFAVSTLESDGTFGEGMHWYTVTLKGVDLTYNAVSNVNNAGNVSAKTLANFYAFTGNPFDGYKMFNYVAGPSKVAWSASVDDNGTPIPFTDLADVTPGTDWALNANKTGYGLRRLGNVANAYVNNRNNNMSYWLSGGAATDDGSRFLFTEVTTDVLETIAADYKTATIATLDEWAKLSVVFDANLIATAKAAVEAVEANSVAAFAEIDSKLTDVTDAVAAKMFTFQTLATDDHRENVWVSANPSTGKAIGAHIAEADYNSIWSLRHAGGSSFYMFNELNQKYMGNPGGNCALSDTPSAAYTFEIVDAANGVVEMKCNGETMHASNHTDDKLLNWDGDEAASRWYIRTINIAAEIEAILNGLTEADYAEVPALGQYTTAAYNALVAARTSAKTVAEVEAAIVAFNKAKNVPVYFITSAWDGGYPKGSAILYNGSAWRWAAADKYNKQMWMTIPAYTQANVPTVNAYDAKGTSYEICDYLTGTAMRGKKVQIVAVDGWDGAYSLQYNADATSTDAAHHAQAGGALVNWKPALANDCQASAWRVEYLGASYDLDQLTDDKMAALSALQATYNNKADLANAEIGEGLGKYSAGNIDAIVAAETAAKNILNSAPAAQAALEISAINAAENALNDAAATLVINMPTAGKYYRIQGACEASLAGYYITGHTNEDGGRIALTDVADASTIYYFDGTNLIAYQSGLVVGLNANHWTFASIEDNSKPASTIVFAQSPRTAGAYTVKSADRYFHYTVYNNTVQVNRCSTDDCKEHDWYLTEVTELPVTIGAAGYATFFTPVEVSYTGIEAYTASSIEGGYVKMADCEGVIPAGEGVILKGNEGAYELTINYEGTKTVETNILAGTAAKTKLTEVKDYYILSIVEDAVGFYKDSFEGNWFQNNSHKAYLAVEATQGALSYGFDFGGTTAIEGIEAVAGEQAIYDLTGRKIEAITVPGLYIINGVKTIVE